MKHPLRLLLFSVLGLVLLGGALGFYALRTVLTGGSEEISREIEVTPESAASLRSAGYPITVLRAYQASSYGGWHGDGGEVIVYRYPPAESAALLAALRIKKPDFSWSETQARFASLGCQRELLDRDFLSRRETDILWTGRPTEGLPLEEYAVDPSAGLLYIIGNRF